MFYSFNTWKLLATRDTKEINPISNLAESHSPEKEADMLLHVLDNSIFSTVVFDSEEA